MTDVDAAQLKLSVKTIFVIIGFLVTFGAGTVSGVISMTVSSTTWKNSVDSRFVSIQTEINSNLKQQQEYNYYEDQKLLWIMENMQEKKNAGPYIPHSIPQPDEERQSGHPQSRSTVPDIASRNHNESTNSPAYTAAMQ